MTPQAATVGRQLEQHLRARRPAGQRPARVRLRQTSHRPASALYLFEVGDGHDQVVVKVPRRRPADGVDTAGDADRPRLVPLTDAQRKLDLEHEAMRSIEAHLRTVADPGLRVVGVRGMLPERGGLVLDAVAQPTLVTPLRAAARQRHRRVSSPLLRAVTNTGRWLRAFHAVPAPTSTAVVREGGRDVTTLLDALVGHLLADGCRRRDVLRRVAALAGRGDPDIFPPSYPVVWSHGDLAPRNVFVWPDGSVAVFDIVGRWRAPMLEDVAYFLTAVETARAQVLGQGLALGTRLQRRIRQWFLAGYFAGGTVPHRALAGYELLLSVDRWASLRALARASRFPDVHVAAVDRFFARRLDRVLRTLAAPTGVGPDAGGAR